MGKKCKHIKKIIFASQTDVNFNVSGVKNVHALWLSAPFTTQGWRLKVALGHCSRRTDASVRPPACLGAWVPDSVPDSVLYKDRL